MPMGKVVNDVKNLKSQSYTFTIYNILMVLLDQCFRMKKRHDSHGVKWCLVASNSYSPVVSKLCVFLSPICMKPKCQYIRQTKSSLINILFDVRHLGDTLAVKSLIHKLIIPQNP